MAQILIFGDSITYGSCDEMGGWASRLRNFTDNNTHFSSTVYNLGISGDNTEGLMLRMEDEIAGRIDDEEETIIIISIGINDSQFVHSKNDFNIPLDEFKENLESIYSIARTHASKVIFIGLTSVDDVKTNPIPWNMDKTYKNDYIRSYNEAIEKTAKKLGAMFVDIFSSWTKDMLYSDGLHPNSKGHEMIFELVKDYLLKNKII